MKKTAIIFSPIFYQHNPGRDHPESAQRLRAMLNELKNRLSDDKRWEFINPHRASIGDLELVHGAEYIKLVKAVCKSGGGLLDLQDTVVSRESFNVALHAVGGALDAVDLVMERRAENAFALVRPPGHHAGRYRACGFCLFNNVAIAAEHLRKRFNMKRIAVLDVDAHHGNGTQEKFYEANEVLYISIHEDPSSFPGTGFTDEVGKGDGAGYNVNIPLPIGTSDGVYLRAMTELVTPIMLQYKPEFILVSAGFDGHYLDPVGTLSLSASAYERIFDMILLVASKTCQGKFVSVLEGGYNVNIVGRLFAIAIGRMAGMSYSVKDRVPTLKKSLESQGVKVLREVKNAQRDFWNIS